MRRSGRPRACCACRDPKSRTAAQASSSGMWTRMERDVSRRRPETRTMANRTISAEATASTMVTENSGVEGPGGEGEAYHTAAYTQARMNGSSASLPLARALAGMTRAGDLHDRLENGAVRCHACGHRCLIPEGRGGVCKVRVNEKGTLPVPRGYVGPPHGEPLRE